MAIDFDFTPFFERYRALVHKIDEVFDRVRAQFPEGVRCDIGCADCCHALFDLSLIEAIYINHRFHQAFEGRKRQLLLEKADQADREAYRIKRQAYRHLQAGKSESEILSEVASQRVRCPLLNDENRCELYADRPITCRVYGIPTAIRGSGHTCGLSGFDPGKEYPTVNLDMVHQQLYELSTELAAALHSRYVRMADMLVPLSMALLTEYNEEYLGLNEPDGAEEKPAAEGP